MSDSFGKAFPGCLLAVAVGWLTIVLSVQAQTPEPDSVPVQIITVQQSPIQSWFVAQGVARAVRREYLSFQSSGKVTAIGVSGQGDPLHAGAQVKGPGPAGEPGQLLVQIDDSTQRTAITSRQAALDQAQQELAVANAESQRAQSNLTLQQQNYQRTQKLYKDKIIKLTDLEASQSQLLDAQAAMVSAQSRQNSVQADISAARAQLSQAQQALKETRILAPFSGTISRLNVRVGDYFSPSAINPASEDSLLRNSPVVLIDTKAYEISLDLPYFQGVQTQVGQTAEISASSQGLYQTASATGTATVSATVHSISPTISPTERTIEVKLLTHGPDNLLRDGLWVLARIYTISKTDALVIPTKSLLFRHNQTFVYVVENNIARWQEVKIGINAYQNVEITSGLQVGDAVVVAGQNRLVDKMPVSIISPAPNQDGLSSQ